MTHTASFSKKIREVELLAQRIQDDQNSLGNSDLVFQSESLAWSITESQAQRLIYMDFYQRVQNEFRPLDVYIAPKFHHYAQLLDVEEVLEKYTLEFSTISKELDRLGIVHQASSLYTWKFATQSDVIVSKLVQDHRVGLRSDVIYYDIQTWRNIPHYRLRYETVLEDTYVVNFFLHARKDTIPISLRHPYELFASAAVLVHPKDRRYKKIHNKELIVPIANTTIPVVLYEWVSVEWLGTRLLLPAHNAEDYALALELWLQTSNYSFDQFWNFASTDNVAEEFRGKNITEFEENIIKYLADIANLKDITQSSQVHITDVSTGRKAYPLLEKNMYLGVGGLDPKDQTFIVSQSEVLGKSESFRNMLAEQEGYVISNKDQRMPSLAKFWGYFQDTEVTERGFFESFVEKFVSLWLLKLPAKWDEIIEIFSYEFQWQYLWELLLPSMDEVDEKTVARLQSFNQGSVDESDIESFLEEIDLWSVFVHTAKGYILVNSHEYHYDQDFIALMYLISQIWTTKLTFVSSSSQIVFFKYLIYLSHFFFKKPLEIVGYILDDVEVFGSSWSDHKTLNADLLRLVFLQDSHLHWHEDLQNKYSIQELDQFISKWRNLCRIVSLEEISPLPEMVEQLQSLVGSMSDYDKYLISSVHKLYEDMVFRISKHQTDKIAYNLVNNLWHELSDILVYVLKIRSSWVSLKVAQYVIVFATHLLYPLIPTTSVGLLRNLGVSRYKHFFEKSLIFDVDKNIKCNFLMQFVTQWYWEAKRDLAVSWFVLRANEDFIEYAKKILPDFYEFLWSSYEVTYLTDRDEWPEEIQAHKVFAMERGVTKHAATQGDQSSLELQESLAMLKKRLSYKQQLMQTLKNTLMRVRTSWDSQSASKYEQQIEDLKQEIDVIEYNISKLKYF